MDPYAVVLADDHQIFRAGLHSLIDKEDFLDVVAEAKDGEELLAVLKKVHCECIVLDLSMPNMDGMAATREIRKRYPEVKILILTMQKDPNHYRCAMSSGASGYMLKDDAYEQLVMAIKLIMRGKTFVSPSLSIFKLEDRSLVLEDISTPSLEILTRRERDVLKLISAGNANKQIAIRLKISIRTVEAHRSHLTNKLGIKTTAGLVKYALSKQLA